MKIQKVIRLIDSSVHYTKEGAERHLVNMLSSGLCLDVFQSLAKKSTMEIKHFFVDNEEKIEQAMQIVRELKEVQKLKF